MVKTTKKLLNFLQLLNKYVQKETKKRNLFIRRWLSFGKKWKPQRGRKATAPLHTPRAFFKSSWLWGCVALLACFCILRCWLCDAVPMWGWVLRLWQVCLYRLLSVFFGVKYGTLCRLLQCSCNEALDVRCTSAGVYKVLFATFRLSVELPVQKHTGTS